MIRIAQSKRPGAYTIASSGSFVLPGDVFAFTLPFEDLSFTISFQYESGGAQNVRVLGSSEKSVEIGLINFDNPLGVTWESQVATLNNNMPLILVLNVVTLASKDNAKPRVITYSFIKRVA
ncbi:DUF6864 domain-containing function [Sinorhizobium sp. 22678]|uniref:DUF6864 domain-containing function n=1 Tax=Sinorhizobium sp. 22678 TaxID=3453955 RepID=UPI003F86554F